MKLTLKTDNEQDIAIILALADRLNIVVEKSGISQPDLTQRERLKERIQRFKATKKSSFGDALDWQVSARKDRDLPFTTL